MYDMTLKVFNFDRNNTDKIKDAAEYMWEFDSWCDLSVGNCGAINAYGAGTLYGGENDKEFAKRLAAAVWAANDGYCEIEVIATYLSVLPSATYSFDEYDYDNISLIDSLTATAIRQLQQNGSAESITT